jgi:hypothetical protein
MSETTLERALDRPFTFKMRPTPLACDLRPEWRLHVLVLLVDHCWGGKASIKQLHVLDWAIRTQETRGAFLQFIHGEQAPNQTIVRYDPSLNRAVDFAFADGLLTNREEQPELFSETEKRQSGPYRVSLAKKGRELVNRLKQEEDIFVGEKQFIKSIGRKLTQRQVEILFDWGVAK